MGNNRAIPNLLLSQGSKASGLKRSAAVPSHQLAALNKRPVKKQRVEFIDLTQDESGESEPEDGEDLDDTASADDAELKEDSEPEMKVEMKREKNGRAQRSKFFMVTDFKNDKAHWEDLYLSGVITYVVGQYEIAPETKRRHLQLYVEVPTKISFATFKQKTSAIHVEARKGTQEQAEEYCTKEESREEGEEPFRFGERASGSGRTSEQARAIEAVKGGMALEQVARDFPGAWVRSYKGLTSLKEALVEERKEKVPIKALCLYGPSGAGKTWKAVDIAKVCSVVWKVFTHLSVRSC